MLKVLLAIIMMSSFSVAASAYKCTAWQKQSGVTCIFAGQDADLYQRQCENPCWRNPQGGSNWGPNCDMSKVCSLTDPSSFKSVCSDWTAVSGVTCYDPNSQTWAQQWMRSCTVGLADSWCSPVAPEN